MIKATIKLILLILWLILCVILLWFIKKTGKKNWRDNFCNFGFCGVCAIIDLSIKVEGELEQRRPLLLVSNHISYLDVMILGAKTPARFTPKSEMAKWPFISTICRVLDCVFIERSSDKIKESRGKIIAALGKGEVISLFPEGTTGDGRHLLPFKSSLFSLAEQKIMTDVGECELLMQPAIITYTAIGALPIDSTQWPSIAWYGDMLLAPHVWQLLKLGRIDARLTLLPAVTMSQFADRKELAVYCYDAASQVLQGR